MRFKNWLENVQSLQSEKDKELRRIWDDTFKSLQVAGLAKADVVRKSLQEITAGSQRKESANTMVMNRLKDVFKRMEQFQDPEVSKQIQQTMEWLGTQPDSHGDGTQPKKTVEGLLRKMFGDKKFEQLLSNDDRSSDMKDDVGLTKMQPGTPPDNTPGSGNAPSVPDQMGVQPNPMMQPGQQPQVPPMEQPPQPNHPPRPAGAELGLF